MFKKLQVQNKLHKIERKIKHYTSKATYLCVTNYDCVSIMQANYIKQFYMLARTNILKQL